MSVGAMTIALCLLYGIMLWALLKYLDGDLSKGHSEIDKALRDIRESDERIFARATALRDSNDERGYTIARLQDALTYWRRRAADKTAEVHELRRQLREIGRIQ